MIATRLFAKAVDLLAGAFVKVSGLANGTQWSASVARHMSDSTRKVGDDQNYFFFVGNPLLLWRAKTLFDKEPETIAWIRSFASNDVFYDIGANIGSYTIYAGRRCRKIFAFEPEAQNFAVLNKNIALNKLHDKVLAFPIALSNESKLDTLRLHSLEAGAALHAFATNIDFKGERFESVFEQGSASFTLDELVFSYGLEFPDFIKIDVDGLENRIVQGGQRVLRDRRLKGLLLELNELNSDDMNVVPLLESWGLKVRTCGEPVTGNAGRFKMRNFIFSRDVD